MLRSYVFRRDGYRCKLCGRSDLPLHLHHNTPTPTTPQRGLRTSLRSVRCATSAITAWKMPHKPSASCKGWGLTTPPLLFCSAALSFREALEPVEKVATGRMRGLEWANTPKNGILGTRTGVRKGHEGIFQQAPLSTGSRNSENGFCRRFSSRRITRRQAESTEWRVFLAQAPPICSCEGVTSGATSVLRRRASQLLVWQQLATTS